MKRRAVRHGITIMTLGVALATAGTGADAGASEPRSVVASARAQGLRATYTVPDYVVVTEFVDGGGPVAEAEADSTGRATSFSSLPWPGENAVTAPGTLSVALGQSVPLAYPFFVQADHPTTPSADLADPSGSYQLKATAELGKASGLARLTGGGQVSGSTATSSAVLDDGGVVRVFAESVDTGISVGDGILRIASVRSRSETTLLPDAPAPTTTSELVIEGAAVAGQPVVIDAEGVHAAEQSVAAPVGAGFSSETDLLRQAGITVKVVPTGVAGGANALLISSRQRMPVPGNPEGRLVMRLGGAASEVVIGSADGAALGAGDVVVPEPASDEASSAPTPAAVTTEPPATTTPAAAFFERPGREAGFVSAPAVDSAAVGPGPVAEPASRAVPSPQPVRTAAPIPELGTTGIVPSVLAAGALGLIVAVRAHRWKMRRL